MTLYRVLDGAVLKNREKFAAGSDVELSAEEVERLNKNGRKTVEPTAVAVAREKADVEKKAAIDAAEKKAKLEIEKAETERKASIAKAEADAKKGGGK